MCIYMRTHIHIGFDNLNIRSSLFPLSLGAIDARGYVCSSFLASQYFWSDNRASLVVVDNEPYGTQA